MGVGHVLTSPDVVPIGCKPQVPTPAKPAHNLQQDMSELNKTVKNIWIRCHLAITCKLKLLKIYAWLNQL